MYIQEYRKKVTNLLKICQVAFNHGAVGHSAKREHRSKISSGAIFLADLWSSALLEFNLLHHRVGIQTEGQMSYFLPLCSVQQPERHPFYVAEEPVCVRICFDIITKPILRTMPLSLHG